MNARKVGPPTRYVTVQDSTAPCESALVVMFSPALPKATALLQAPSPSPAGPANPPFSEGKASQDREPFKSDQQPHRHMHR